jgi:hypothetical protein
MSAPHASGALALLLSAYPNLSADRQAAGLESSALDLGGAGPDNDFGYGRLDVLGAFYWLANVPDYTLTVSPSPATVAAGDTATYTVTVTSVNGFSGEVSLALSGLPASGAGYSFAPPMISGGAGTSTLTLTTPGSVSPGTYGLTITATSGSISHTVPLDLIITPPPDFDVSAAPGSASTSPGGAVSYIVTVGAVNGFTGDVSLALSGLPASKAGWTFAPPTITGGAGTSTLTVTTAGSLAPGTYALTITATSAAVSHPIPISLVVARDFTVSVDPPSLTLSRGQSGTYAVTTAPVGGFRGTVALSVTGLPAGASASFAPKGVVAPASSVLTVRTKTSTRRGTFTVTLIATRGSLIHTASLTLVVT